MTTTYKFKAAYTKLGFGATPSVAPVCTIVDSSNNILVNALAATALTNLTGVYLYSYTGADGLDLTALFHTTDLTLDQQDLYAVPFSNCPSIGPGATAYVITINDNGGLPLDGVNVWITTDIAGTNTIWSGFTNTLGQVSPYLDAGTYYAWKQLAGYSFTNPEAFTV